ncbi:hypothetical protein KKF86_03310 [bacterium]|nr:hypothetical protein [bacterium]
MMNINFNKNLPQVLLSILLIFILINSTGFAQKKKPLRTTTVPQDTTLTVQEKPKSSQPTDPGLPTIELNEKTIVGERIITSVPDTKKTTDKTNIPIITENPTGVGKGNRLVSGAGGIKMDQSIFYPTTNISNQFYSSYGRYNDINTGLKLRQQFIDDELFVDMDYRWNSGHIKNSDYRYSRNTLTNIHRFTRYLQNKTQFTLTDNTYKFYGALVNPQEKRSRMNLDISSTTGVTGWELANIRWDAGVRYMDPDDSQLFNWGLWTDLNLSKTIGTSFLTGNIKLISDRIEIPLNPNQLDSLYTWVNRNTDQVPIKYLEKVRDDITNNSLLSNSLFGNVRSTIEHVFARNLKVKGGLNIFYHKSSNEHGLILGGDEISNLPNEDELTTIYPILGMDFNLGPMGSLFGIFEPKLENISLVQILNINPYINMSAPLTYRDLVSDLKLGWKRSGTYDLSFEIYYNYKDINNYGIFIPQDWSTEEDNIGHWDIVYNNDVVIHEIRTLLNWRINDYISIWSATGYKNYSITKSNHADQIPYFPKFDFDFAIRALPGSGIELMLNGQFISEQFTSQFKTLDNNDNVIEPYFVGNFSISKKIGKHIEIYGQMNNILDTAYETWKGYSAHRRNGWGGIKVFW